MKEQDVLDIDLPMSYTTLGAGKQNGLCWELKQLFLAITRSTRRLWICETTSNFFQYSKMGLDKLLVVSQIHNLRVERVIAKNSCFNSQHKPFCFPAPKVVYDIGKSMSSTSCSFIYSSITSH